MSADERGEGSRRRPRKGDPRSDARARLRAVLPVALAYLAGAVVVDLLVRPLIPLLVLPPSFLPLARVLMALGFVVLVAATWVHAGSREGRR